MASWTLVFVVIVAAVGIQSALGFQKALVQVDNDANLGSKEVIVKGDDTATTIIIKDKAANTLTTIERIKDTDIQITRYNEDPTCYVRFGDKKDGESKCSENVLMGRVPPQISERCDGEVFVVKPKRCDEVENMSRSGCHFGCWLCWGICCGWECD